MAGIAPRVQQAAEARPVPARQEIVFVPVDGRLVFCVCVLLITACVLWAWMLWRQGRKADA